MIVPILIAFAVIALGLFMFPTVYRHFISHHSANEAKHVKKIKPEEIIIEDNNVSVTIGEVVSVSSRKLANIVLTHDEIRITWQGAKSDDDSISIPTHDIVAVKQTSNLVVSITSYSPNDKPRNSKEYARVKQLTHLLFTEARSKAWVSAILSAANLLVDPRQPQLKRRFLIFINPVSGTRKAREQWKSVQLLLGSASHVAYTAIETEFAGHASQVVKDFNFDEYHGVLVISGDGLMFEIINAVMGRADASSLIKKLTFGIIPTGSGNGLASTLGMLKDIDETLIKAIQGRTKQLDLMGIRQGANTLYSFVQISYGFISDVDFGSEVLRFLGEARFDIYATWRWIMLREYHAKIKMLCLDTFSHEGYSTKKSSYSKEYNKHSEHLVQCNKHHCEKCESCDKMRALAEWEDDMKRGNKRLTMEQALQAVNKTSKHEHQLVTVDEKIIFFTASNLSHIGGAVYNGPFAHLSDGYTDIALIRKSRLDWLPMAALLTTLDNGDIDKYRMVEYYKVKEFELEADHEATKLKDKHLAKFDIDGERFDSIENLRVKVYQGLISVFG